VNNKNKNRKGDIMITLLTVGEIACFGFAGYCIYKSLPLFFK